MRDISPERILESIDALGEVCRDLAKEGEVGRKNAHAKLDYFRTTILGNISNLPIGVEALRRIEGIREELAEKS